MAGSWFDFGLSVLALGRILVLSHSLAFTGPAQEANGHQEGVRPCTARETGGLTSKKASKRKSKSPGPANAGVTCLEVRATPLSVQEHLQAFVREQKWRVGDEDIGESFWTFSVALRTGELLGYAKTDSTNERVQWRAGKALVSVRSTDLSNGYTRVILSAHFDGYGDPGDDFSIKRESWALISNGRLETTLAGALRARFEAAH